MVYEAWVAPSFEAAGCVAPRFCGIGTDRSPLIIDAARDVTPALSKPTAWQAAPQPGSATARPPPGPFGPHRWMFGCIYALKPASSDGVPPSAPSLCEA